MNHENFAYWLQGAFELGGLKALNAYQVQIVQDHLNLVFNKQTPNRVLQSIKDKFETPVTTLPFPRFGDTVSDIANMPPVLSC